LDKDGSEEYKVAERLDGYNSEVTVIRKGDFVIPVEVEFTWEDGKKDRELWDGMASRKVFQFEGASRLVSAQIDPDYKVRIDLDYNNNSLTHRPEKKSLWKYAMRSVYWVQNALQATNFLM